MARSTQDKLGIFRRCFSGLAHVYGTYDPRTGRAWQIKAAVTDAVLLAHLTGRQPYGVYLLDDDYTSAVVADFDDEDTEPPRRLVELAQSHWLSCYVERSKSKGYHVWVFFREPVPARKARGALGLMLRQLGYPSTEIFPKQDRLDAANPYGNFINAPLFAPRVAEGRTVFVDPDTLEPFPDQWEVLEGARQANEDHLDRILQHLGGEAPFGPEVERTAATRQTADTMDLGDCRFGLPPCARRMLQGVSEHQRVACFRLGVHFKRIGIPQDLAPATLNAWRHKNRPQGKEIITESEIRDQVRCAYEKPYRGFGCEDPIVHTFCDDNCPLRAHPVTRLTTGGRRVASHKENHL